MGLRDAVRALGSSLLTRAVEYVGPRDLPTGTTFEDGYERQVNTPPVAQTRWHLADLEGATFTANSGNLSQVGRLWRSLKRDGQIAGVLSTRTLGLVQLPIRFAGDDELVKELAADFRRVFPLSELALLAGDGIGPGVGVGEFVQVDGRLPVLRRLDPEFLQYRWNEDRWYYRSIHGLLPVNPGDGRWVLHCPSGAVQPWSHGNWAALGRSYIAKEHAFYFRENYSSKLANAARVAVAPSAATEDQQLAWFQKVAAWGVNSVFGVKPGYDVKLLESNGRGYEVFQDTIKTANEEIIVTLAGQLVTTTGGAGFQNAAIFSTIRTDLIQADADALAETLMTQAIPVWANERFGAAAAEKPVRAYWDVTPQTDLTKEAAAIAQAAVAVKTMNEALAPYGQRVKIDEIARKFGVPLEELEEAVAQNENTLRSITGGKAAA